MNTPFDAAIAEIAKRRYHNHRLETHSDVVSELIYGDLLRTCESLRKDVEAGVVRKWLNVPSPGDRARRVDLFVGEPAADGTPDIAKVRIAIENKPVITAHRNRTNRFDDLSKVLGAIHSVRPEAILIGTVLIGLSRRVLNIPDRVHPMFQGREDEFDAKVLPRLASGDEALWTEFPWAISKNSQIDPRRTLELLQSIPTRRPGLTHVQGYDVMLAVPVLIDNVNPPQLPRPNELGIDVDADYSRMLEQVCSAYTSRWHT